MEYNINFFRKQSRDLAYFLGFHMADGYMIHNNRKHVVEITIHPKDIDVLYYFRSMICPDAIIKVTKNVRKDGFVQNRARFCIFSKEICSILVDQFKIPTQKTGHEIIPFGLKPDFYNDFVRGVFDGDGWVSNNGKDYIVSGIVSASKVFLEQIKGICGDLGIVRKGSCIYHWSNYTRESCLFRNFIYNNEPFSLLRKKNLLFSVTESDITQLKFTQREIDIIRRYYNEMPVAEIAALLDRPMCSVVQKAHSLGIYKRETQSFTPDEIEFIRSWFDPVDPKESICYIAECLDRTISSVQHKVSRLKLRNLRRHFNKEEVEFIKENMNKPVKWIAEKLDRKISSIYSKLNEIGIGNNVS